MIARLRDESGIALATAIIVLLIIIGLGLAAVGFADSQQSAAGRERTREASFSQAEGLLNSQMFQLARGWPTAASPATAKCTQTTAASGATCPVKANLDAVFTGPDYNLPATCATDVWRTYIQDDDAASGGTQYYDPTVMNPGNTAKTFYSYDQNNNNSVWVRAETAAKCDPTRRQVVVALATRSLAQIQWPTAAIAADWFRTTNAGKKVIINTQGPATNPPHDPANMSLRCSQPAASYPSGKCKNYAAGQVAPDTVPSSPSSGTPIVGSLQLSSLKQQAQVTGTYYGGQDGAHPACPGAGSPSISALATGTVVYIEGSAGGCTISASGNANPIILVIAKGSYSIGGNASFKGLVYAANTFSPQSTGALVTLGGCAHIQGLVAVDGPGGVNVGSCKNNLVYDPTILPSLKAYGGITIAKNSFRQLRGNAPAEP